jgi:hypothetical protein
VERYKKLNLGQRKKDDKTKMELCKKHKITLIVVDYTIAFKDMQKYIVEECKKHNVQLPEKMDYVDFRKLDVYDPKELEKLQKIAQERGGECLSTKYFGTKVSLEFRCENNHKFWMQPGIVKGGHWCQECAKKKVANISNMRRLKAYDNFKGIVEGKKGKILSEYVDSHTRIHLMCEKGHDWWVKPNGIMLGYWCRRCAERKKGDVKKLKSYKALKSVVEGKKGKILSEYINALTKIHIDCGKGHDWWVKPCSIMRGQWCPNCAKMRRRGIRKYNRNYKQFPHKHIL